MAEKITVPTPDGSITKQQFQSIKISRKKVSADEPLVELETDKVNVDSFSN